MDRGRAAYAARRSGGPRVHARPDAAILLRRARGNFGGRADTGGETGSDGGGGREGMKIRKVGVLGAGLMGSGIAEVAAKAGYDTVVRAVTEDLAKKGMGRIESSLSKAVEKGK